jgi:hypothetical protein
MLDKLSGFSSHGKSDPILCGAPEGVKMAKLKISSRISGDCTQNVYNCRRKKNTIWS